MWEDLTSSYAVDENIVRSCVDILKTMNDNVAEDDSENMFLQTLYDNISENIKNPQTMYDDIQNIKGINKIL